MMLSDFVVVVAIAVVLLFVLSLIAHARSASSVPQSANPALVVLGYPSRPNGRPHPIQRWRSALAVKTASTHQAKAVVFTGGGTKGREPESEVMAAVAGELGLNDGEVVIESESSDTWENVACAAPLVADADCVILVSDPLHAARARRYWLKQNPEDTGRVFVTDCCGFWDGWWLKVPTALDAAKQSLRGMLAS